MNCTRLLNIQLINDDFSGIVKRKGIDERSINSAQEQNRYEDLCRLWRRVQAQQDGQEAALLQQKMSEYRVQQAQI